MIKPETCVACSSKIKFYKNGYKCQECSVVCHLNCRDKVPLPCVPMSHTPTKKGVMGSISDYTPLVPPMVPALIVHAINEIENRGLKEIGLYRVSGSDKEIKDLKENFLKGKAILNLSKIDIHSLCGLVKDFLRTLQEPLITKSLWQDFVEAAEIVETSFNDKNKSSALYQAISQLPQPNRDTLAFVVLHLQRVAASPDCKMPIPNLAKVFGPTVVGFSSGPGLLSSSNMLSETTKQCTVMLSLLNISNDYWSRFINLQQEDLYASTPVDNKSNLYVSRLGPFLSSDQSFKVQNSTPVQKTPLTPKASKKTMRRQKFFSSPMLK